MARYSSVKIGNLFLTGNGLAVGTPCKLTVKGLDDAALTISGQSNQSADGTVFLQLIETLNKGLQISIEIDFIPKTVLDLIVTAVKNTLGTSQSQTLTVTGDTGNFVLSVVPNLPDFPKFSGKFSNGIVQGVTLNFIVI